MKISVIMPVYNCERYLEAALQSVLTQSVSDLEIIAVEDCSTDSSREILLREAQKDARIRPICNERNVGVSAVRNIALQHATGEYIAFCDSDDIRHCFLFVVAVYNSGRTYNCAKKIGDSDSGSRVAIVDSHDFVHKDPSTFMFFCIIAHYRKKGKVFPPFPILYVHKPYRTV